MPWRNLPNIFAVSSTVSPREICKSSACKTIGWPPSSYMPASNERRVRVLFLKNTEPPALSAQRIEHSGGAQLFVAVREFKHLRGFGGGQIGVS